MQEQEFGTVLTDLSTFIKTSVAEIGAKPTTRQGAKTLTLAIVDRWIEHAKTTTTSVDDAIAAALRHAVDAYFDTAYEKVFSNIRAEYGESMFVAPSVASIVDEIIDAPQSADDATFAAADGKVLELVKTILPIVLRWYFGV